MLLLNAVIIDDEPGNIVTLRQLIKTYCPTIVCCGTASNIKEGAMLIKNTSPDIVFLDIQMPGGSGFDLLDNIKEPSFEIIFVTAFDNHAIKAFKYAALYYILKPVAIKDLQDAVQKVTEKLRHKAYEGRIALLMDNLKKEDRSLHRIGLPVANGLYFQDVKTITHLKAEGSYTKVYTEDNKCELISKSLREFEDILPPALFCRVHHSHLINMNFVKRYYKGRGGYVEMTDGTEIEVAVRKKDDFLNRFK